MIDEIIIAVTLIAIAYCLWSLLEWGLLWIYKRMFPDD